MKTPIMYSDQTDRERILEHMLAEIAFSYSLQCSIHRVSPLGIRVRHVCRDHETNLNPLQYVRMCELKPGTLVACRSVRDGIGVGYFLRTHPEDGIYMKAIGFEKEVHVSNESFVAFDYRNSDGTFLPLDSPQNIFLIGRERKIFMRIRKACHRWLDSFTHIFAGIRFSEDGTDILVRIREKFKAFAEAGYFVRLPMKGILQTSMHKIAEEIKKDGYGDDTKFQKNPEQ